MPPPKLKALRLEALRLPAKRVAARLGYQLKRVPKGPLQPDGYVLYGYSGADGAFDLDEYRRVQIEGNKRKIRQVWAREENIEFLSQYLQKSLGSVGFGICHGTRRGLEQGWFRKYLDGCEVIGTEISDTATEFPHTIQWDFHEAKPEWLGATDFIYSNSLDHSYDPESCLNTWMRCIRPGGICILEHGRAHGPGGASQLDPFGAELAVMPYLIARWGRGEYCVREVLPAPPGAGKRVSFLVIHKF